MLVRYTKYYHRMQGADLVVDLLNDPRVQQEFQVGSSACTPCRTDRYSTWTMQPSLKLLPLGLALAVMSASRTRRGERGTSVGRVQPAWGQGWRTGSCTVFPMVDGSARVWHDLHGVSFTSSSPIGMAVMQVLRKGGQWAPLGSPVGKADVRLVASSLTRCAYPRCTVGLDQMRPRVMCAGP